MTNTHTPQRFGFDINIYIFGDDRTNTHHTPHTRIIDHTHFIAITVCVRARLNIFSRIRKEFVDRVGDTLADAHLIGRCYHNSLLGSIVDVPTPDTHKHRRPQTI